MDVARSAPQGGSLPCGRYLLAPLTGNTEGSKCLMVLRVRPTSTRFPTNSLYTPMGNTPLHSISSVCQTCSVVVYHSCKSLKGFYACCEFTQEIDKQSTSDVGVVKITKDTSTWIFLHIISDKLWQSSWCPSVNFLMLRPQKRFVFQSTKLLALIDHIYIEVIV